MSELVGNPEDRFSHNEAHLFQMKSYSNCLSMHITFLHLCSILVISINRVAFAVIRTENLIFCESLVFVFHEVSDFPELPF